MHGTQWPSKFVSLGDLVDSASILFGTLLQTFESEILQQLAVATKSEVENPGSLQSMMSAAESSREMGHEMGFRDGFGHFQPVASAMHCF